MRHVLVPQHIGSRPPALGAQLHALDGQTMGTYWSVRCTGPRQLDLGAVRSAVCAELDDVVAQMSTWEPGSDLSRFNAAPAGHWQVLPPACFEVLQCGLQVAQASDGAYDPTAGAAVERWGFGPAPRFDAPGFAPPTPGEVAAALAHCGWQRLAVRPATREVRQPGGLRLDLSAIAKGHAVDRVADALQRLGLDDLLVDIGGELLGRGTKPDGQPWWVGIERPPGSSGADSVVALHGLAIATSGDYRRCFLDAAGQRRSHTIDPRSGWPVEHGLASVSVLHQRCMLADAWSTALTVLGPAAGLACAERSGLAALFVVRRPDGRFEEFASRAWSALAQ